MSNSDFAHCIFDTETPAGKKVKTKFKRIGDISLDDAIVQKALNNQSCIFLNKKWSGKWLTDRQTLHTAASWHW